MKEVEAKKQVDNSFSEVKKPTIGKMYHIKGMYKGCFFRLIDLGNNYAILEYPSKISKRKFNCKISDLRRLK